MKQIKQNKKNTFSKEIILIIHFNQIFIRSFYHR